MDAFGDRWRKRNGFREEKRGRARRFAGCFWSCGVSAAAKKIAILHKTEKHS